MGVRTFTTAYRLIKNHHISEIFSSSGESEFSLKRRPFGHFCSLPIKSSVKTSVLCNGSELHRSKKLLVVYSGEVRRVYRGMPCCCKIAHRVLREKWKVSDICKKSDICNPLPRGPVSAPILPVFIYYAVRVRTSLRAKVPTVRSWYVLFTEPSDNQIT